MDHGQDGDNETPPWNHRSIAGVSTALAVLAVVALLLGTAGGRDQAPPDPDPTAAATSPRAGSSSAASPQPRPVSADELEQLPAATTFGDIPAAPRDPAPDQPATGQVAHPARPMPLFTAPGGEPVAAVGPTQPIGIEPARAEVDTWLPILHRQPGWAMVSLPSRPNNTVAWLHLGPEVIIATTPYAITVDRARMELVLHRDGQLAGRWTVGVGKPEATTPNGRTFLLAVVHDPQATYSPVILPLGTHSDTHQTYGGGPGTVGIHTWPDPAGIGSPTSDGCIRVPADALDALTAVPLGTPVSIT